MNAERLRFAIDKGGLTLPSEGRIALMGALAEDGLPIKAERCEIIQTFRPEVDAWQSQGAALATALNGPYAAVIVTLPRARDLAETWIARAEEAAAPGGLVVVNGAKTDGIESIAKALKGKVAVQGQVSKAHGKCLWFTAGAALADWARPAMARNASGDMTAPGVFSADGPDPASQALAEVLPDTLKGVVADLGAGWGWLSREILKRPAVKHLHLVEAEQTALDCARLNVSDPRAEFHWADATRWAPQRGLDVVVMNPPFHVGRKADPKLGQAFVAAAARILAPHGQLWMVANRHLPYEVALAHLFREHSEIAGNSKFKILHAARPTRQRR
ncbi:class I SAM-dependent methyltransferase [Tropicibacter oceani]|uniref:Class I SAM-dependent methyltransferase n=1 Tax=Tropicibacter oceani TaxID=3058420 RepID=A0ABY8QL36_9RHOB|nr:class I SAM-dependent methyltransferase [Tropicibacter oceani]WGW05344.1 class I SAM-dependent methyltransferase [Tropicibacter oceani]